MFLHRLLPCLSLLAALHLAPTARAHDPLLIEIDAQVAPTEFIVKITFARSVAAYLAGVGPAPRVRFAAADFEGHRAAFEQTAPGLCALYANDTALAPMRTAVALVASNHDEDIVYTLVYPRPAPGPLRIDWLWLPRLPAFEGYAAAFRLRSAIEPDAAPLLVTFESPVSKIEIAAPPPPTASP